MTKGPWRIGDAGTAIFGPKQIDGSLSETIATNIRSPDNAKLIASAPQMLKALKFIAKCPVSFLTVQENWKIVFDAIKAAESDEL